jgi:7,8-dihydropterin-6-yl-methyl-4-(beta-D-ribofuranosyl)aminobenzene 5'-phosphate synthase
VNARESVIFLNHASENELHITIIYDNYQVDESLGTDWGYACLVEYQGNKILFDAGAKADLYKQNMELLQINPMEIPHLFISHEHGDHTAGMPWITSINPSAICYLPDNYANDLRSKDRLPKNSLGLSKPTHLYGPFYSTGDDFQSFKEQGLVIKTEHGGVLLTGCGHPGAIEMLELVKEELGIEVHTLIGGLHLMRSTDNELAGIVRSLKDMGIEQICPTHCTGDHSIAYFEKSFGEGYISGGTGKEIVIK